MRVTAAQVDPTVGDIAGNVAKIVATLSHCARDEPDLVVFPELFLVGYPPKDLLERDWFVAGVQAAIEEIKRVSLSYPRTGVLVGAPIPTGLATGKGLYNAAVLICNGEIVATQGKSLLPTYDVFDEARYFDPAPEVRVMAFKGERLGSHICEDAWTDAALWTKRNLYTCDPVNLLDGQGATVFVNISASPFNVGKEALRYRVICEQVHRYHVPFLYINQIGGNDDLVFDGRSMLLDRNGDPLAVLDPFREHVLTVDTNDLGNVASYMPQDEIASVHDALVLGLSDYACKTGFTKVVIGLSGGIDSAVTCCLAASALGCDNVLGVAMPSPYSSPGSVSDARDLARSVGVQFKVIPITPIYEAYLGALREHFAGRKPNEAEENVQARIRGNILMALSNKFGYLVLSTGNKSEMSVGYCTLYGDMSGGLAVISDVPKTMVYQLARYINREREWIPRSSIDKPPSAELRPNQVDQDTLPPYPVLDQILHHYVEDGLSVSEVVAQGFDLDTVRWVARTVDRNEYKRKQAAPGLKVTTKAFGVGRRMPIAAKFAY